MSERRPLVTIGLPVFNGENFLSAAIESLLSQTFEDIEVVICDNASTDNTEDICRAAASRDSRIVYVRNEKNLGASANFNRAFELGRAKYFKWAACDDLCAPTFVQKCVDVLEKDRSIVLCYTGTDEIDSQDQLKRIYDFPPLATSDQPHVRFRDLVVIYHPCVAVFGLIRREVLEQTRLIPAYVGADRVLLAELGLRGRFHEIPEVLFHRRIHEGNSIWLNQRGALLAWYDPRIGGRVNLPNWRILGELATAVRRAPLSWSARARCWMQLPRHIRTRRRPLRDDLVMGVRLSLARIGPLRSLVRLVRDRRQVPRDGA